MKLNSGRRGKRRKSASKPRNSKGHFVKANGRRKSRRNKRRGRRNGKSIVAKVFNNGRRRGRRNGRKLGAKRSSSGRFVKANGRRYKRRGKKNAVKLNRRRGRRHAKHNGKRRARRNPGFFSLQLATLKDSAFVLQVAHVGAGIVGTSMLGNLLLKVPGVDRLTNLPGALGTAGRAAVCVASAAGLSALAYAGRNVKLIGPNAWKNVLVGGALYSALNVLAELVDSPYVPRISVGRGGRASSGAINDWMELSGGVGGMGAVYSAADLVAGESAAQPFQMGGLGSGGVPIPIEDLRGYPGQYGGGLRDWVELQPDAAVDKDAVGAAGESF